MDDSILRAQLVTLLTKSNAHMTFEDVVQDFPIKEINTCPPNVTYSFWHLIEHLRITQRDILDFITKPDYKALQWPDDYWPKPGETADETKWNESIRMFRNDLEMLTKIVTNPVTDLSKPLSWGKEYTVLREILLVSDHNAYHIGEFGILRQVTETWNK